jgi:mannan endo-1,4-beta-mannosidase
MNNLAQRFIAHCRRSYTLLFTALIVLALGTLPTSTSCAADSGFANFITARDGKLYDGDQPFRFISFNIPNLSYTEDNMQFNESSGFRLPTKYEIDDALATIAQMGGRAARLYVLSVHKKDDPPGVVRHILAPDQLNEEAMVVLDQVLESANRHGVRLIIPFVDQASWWGGIQELAAFRGKAKDDFYTDPQVKQDYKDIVKKVLNRTNTLTGVKYKDDKAVLCWELGNELRAPKEWVREMAPVVKELDPKHLVAESYFTDPDNAGVDIVQDHLYQGNPVAMVDQIHKSLQRAAGHNKVYWVGEFGFVTTEGMRDIINTVINEPGAAGALIWSLRFHDKDGGYYWHHEPHGGDFFKAYHWPGGPMGEPYDETRFMKMVRDKAYEIQKQSPPDLTPPQAPELTEVTDSGIVNWRGAAGAGSYNLQRSKNASGPWQTVAYQLSDDASQYHPLAADETAKPSDTYYYRLIARNEAGDSAPSKTFGPVTIRARALVDELNNMSHTYRSGGKLEVKSNDARNFKEDFYRLSGSAGSWIAYKTPGPIVAIRVYAFGDKAAPELEFRSGVDAAAGEKLTPETQDFFAGKEMYNYRWPRLYTLNALPNGGDSFTISFTKEVQISRIEIEYK